MRFPVNGSLPPAVRPQWFRSLVLPGSGHMTGSCGFGERLSRRMSSWDVNKAPDPRLPVPVPVGLQQQYFLSPGVRFLPCSVAGASGTEAAETFMELVINVRVFVFVNNLCH